MSDRFYQGKRVSYPWYCLFIGAEQAGIEVTLNSGRRTMSEQRYFWNNQPPLAAYPRPTAPHIRIGRDDHAVDVDCANGSAERFRRYCLRLGIILKYTVRGECWHLEVVSKDWKRKLPAIVMRPTIRPGQTHASVATAKYQLRKRGYAGNPKGQGFGWINPIARRRHVGGSVVAVKAFQADNGLKADGVIGPSTWRALLKGTGVSP